MIYASAAEPTALWNDGTRWTVIDNLGQAMPKLQAADYGTLTKTTGAGGPEAVPVLEKAFALAPSLRDDVDHARRVAGRRWDLVLKSGAVMKLPTDERLAASLLFFANVEPAAELARRPLSIIDLRVAGRVFLTPKSDQLGGAA